MIFFISTLFIFLNHPISLGLILLLQTICISIITGLINFNFWFSYILFLVIIGGLLILFIYITRVASNEKFKFSTILILPPTVRAIFIIIINLDITNIYLKINETLKFNYNIPTFLLNKYFNFPSSRMALFLIIYLLLTLVVIVKLTKKNIGPIRQIT